MAAYVALLPYQIQITSEVRLAPADGFLLLALVLAPAQLKHRSMAWSAWHWMLIPLFILGSLVTALNTGHLSHYALLNKTVGLLLLCLTYLTITSATDDWQTLRRLLRVFVLSVILQNAVAIIAFFAAYSSGMDNPWTSQDGRRLSGLLVDPNAYGGLLVLTLALLEGGASGPVPLFRGRLLTFSRLTLASGMLLTFSRTAWMSLALVLAGLWTLRPRTIAPVLLGALAAVLLVGSAASERFLSFATDMAVRPEQVRGRFELVEVAWSQFRENPLIGAGLSNFWNTEGTIVHNTPLWFLADFGLLGFVVFLGFVAWFFAKGRLALRTSPATQQPMIVGLMLGHIAMLGLAMGIEAFYQRHWWLVMALIGSSYSLSCHVKRSSLANGRSESDWQTGPFQLGPRLPERNPLEAATTRRINRADTGRVGGRRVAAATAAPIHNQAAEGTSAT